MSNEFPDNANGLLQASLISGGGDLSKAHRFRKEADCRMRMSPGSRERGTGLTGLAKTGGIKIERAVTLVML